MAAGVEVNVVDAGRGADDAFEGGETVEVGGGEGSGAETEEDPGGNGAGRVRGVGCVGVLVEECVFGAEEIDE